MDDTLKALDLILMTDQEKGRQCNKYEVIYLREEAKKGLHEFSEACRIVFGENLSELLYETLYDAQVTVQYTYDCMTNNLDEEEAGIATLLAYETVLACKLIFQIQSQMECDKIAQSEILNENIIDYARKIRLKLDPKGIFCPEAADI